MKAQVYLLLVVVIPLIFSQPYHHFETLNLSPHLTIYSIDISESNEIIVAGGQENKTSVFEKKQKGYEKIQDLTESTGAIQVVDITADGQWIMSIGEDSLGLSFAFIYKRNKRTKIYEIFQQILFGFSCQAGAITDDHQWLALSEDYFTIVEVHIYAFEDDKFKERQIIQLGEDLVNIYSISLTSDHEFLAASTVQGAYIYRFNETLQEFQFDHVLSLYSSSSYRQMFMTDDHQYLMISKSKSPYKFTLYNYNEETEEFEDEEVFNYNPYPVYYASMTENKQWIAASTRKGVNLHSYADHQENHLLQESSFYHRFSKDGKFFINALFYTGQISIFHINCSYYQTDQHFFNFTSQKCELCSIPNCKKCESFTKCMSCEKKFSLDNNNKCIQSTTPTEDSTLIIVIVVSSSILVLSIIISSIICIRVINKRMKKQEMEKMEHQKEEIKDVGSESIKHITNENQKRVETM